jgi:phage terminase large subunit
MEKRIEMPRWADDFTSPARYKVAYGGRGSSKSWTFARMILLEAIRRPILVLCAREIQGSIRDSVHRLLINQIEELGVSPFFVWGENHLRGRNGTEFLFKGLRHNVEEIKSTEAVDICWVEEAHFVREDSWKLLTPTVRAPGSEIWITFNPEDAAAPTYKRFVLDPPKNSIVRKVNWRENPWFPPELDEERREMLERDPDAYQTVWEGECRTHSGAQVLRGKWIVEEFTPGEFWEGPFYGADWGFSVDPTTLIRCWIYQDQLFIEHEVFGYQVSLRDTPRLFRTVPEADRHTIRADSARPETIKHIRDSGFPKLVSVEKWPGSVEDGVERLRAFRRIVIHPRCVHTIREATLWRHKVNNLTGDVLTGLVDADNHAWDAIRYALAPIIRNRSTGPQAAARRRRTIE